MKKIVLFLFLVAVFIATGCSTTRLVEVGGKKEVTPRVVYVRQPEERDPIVAQAREIGRKMARYKESRHRACIELRAQNPYADCIRALGPVEMTCWGYGNGNYSCNP